MCRGGSDDVGLGRFQLMAGEPGDDRQEGVIEHPLPAHRFQDGEPAERHVDGAVPTLVGHHDSTSAAGSSGIEHVLGHHPEASRCDHLARQWVHHSRVEARRDEDEIRSERLHRGNHDFVHDVEVAAVAGAWRQRDVEREAHTRALAVFVEATQFGGNTLSWWIEIVRTSGSP